MRVKDHIINLSDHQQIDLTEISCADHDSLSANTYPVMMVHGAMGIKKIFYNSSLKGLAPYLAKKGHRVFVVNLRGRGHSLPLAKDKDFSQLDLIQKDIPEVTQWIIEYCNAKKINWIPHSWSGVLMAACLARRSDLIDSIHRIVYLGVKRQITTKNIQRFLGIDLMWSLIGLLYGQINGYVKGALYQLPSDEAKGFHRDCTKWIYSSRWCDPTDGFDYRQALAKQDLPPILSFAAKNDTYLAHPRDVELFLRDCGKGEKRFVILGKTNGNKKDYNHSSMLTDPIAAEDYFEQVAEWLIDSGNLKSL